MRHFFFLTAMLLSSYAAAESWDNRAQNRTQSPNQNQPRALTAEDCGAASAIAVRSYTAARQAVRNFTIDVDRQTYGIEFIFRSQGQAPVTKRCHYAAHGDGPPTLHCH